MTAEFAGGQRVNVRVLLVAPATLGLTAGLLLARPEADQPFPAAALAPIVTAGASLPAGHAGLSRPAPAVYRPLWGPGWTGTPLAERAARTPAGAVAAG
ncbi:MAG TPA: hypothetical protein VH478_07395 [Trebonia sp.]|jgi:hypothetical protein|nr:hypothetical protein [Trebonia sp.]